MRRRRSFGRNKINELRREFIRNHWRSILSSFAMLVGLSLVVAVVPIRQIPGWERGWAVGLLTASWLGLVTYLFMEEGNNAFRVYGVWAKEDWSRDLLKNCSTSSTSSTMSASTSTTSITSPSDLPECWR